MLKDCTVSLNVTTCSVRAERAVRCFACGSAVCRSCSEIVKRYARWRRTRICNDCMTDHAESIERYPQWRPEFNDALTLPKVTRGKS